MSSPHRPRKRFGQHFLSDEFILQQMAKAIHPKPDQFLVEIGPGQGALTQHLVDQVAQLDAIEIDRDLVAWLTEHYKNKSQFHCHQHDVLKFDFHSLKQQQKLRVIGNLPYNISSPLLFKLFDSIDLIEDMFFLLQQEVVDRLVATVGSANYNRLSVMSQYFCKATQLFEVKPTAFTPPPKVNSAFIRLQPVTRDIIANDFKKFSDLVRQAFCYRRKMIGNCLKKMLSQEQLTSLGIDPSLRPQELTVEDYIHLSNAL
ncbi:MAG: 16S rRNA (adenine(1518)-N(6)/adenine(1519)-N(6))-dimethyltransferase RsmA [Gammaproteobacteria bacterium]|nr:16S rRNA (adenine(1518)-N(6)/adenine(1519)-N(6))-dimethyltransferase RsmA [Gammaproteobacteria bacterium]